MSTRSACPRCGHAITLGVKFCSECGLDVSGSYGGVPTGASVAAESWKTVAEMLREATTGEYEVIRELGRGGMAMVFLAREVSLNRKVAIKVMSPALGTDGGMVERFKREAQTAASLSHPNIIPVYAVRETTTVTFFVMKFVPGRTLDSLMEELGEMPVEMVRPIITQVAGALGYGHKRGVIHRDVKPGNIMIDDEGWAVVMDFGIAKVEAAEGLTQTGAAIGTPTYMSPEQCASKPVTGASDQYSLGVVAYEMLTGTQPFDGDSVMAVMYGHVHEPPPPFHDARPDCPPELHDAVMRMLEKRPGARFRDMDELISAIGGAFLKHDDPVRTELMTLASAGLSAKILEQVRTPRSPIPLGHTKNRSGRGAAAQQRSAERSRAQEAPTEVTPTPPPLQSSSPSGAHSLTGRRWAGILGGLAAVVIAVAVIVWSPWAGARVEPVALPPDPPPPVAQPAAVATVAIVAPESTLFVGDRMQITARVGDASGQPLGDAVIEWRSQSPGVASISETGMIAAQGLGSTTISARVDDVISSFPLMVQRPRSVATRQPVATVVVSWDQNTILPGGAAQFLAAPRDADGSRLSGRPISWQSSDPEVATVSPDGTVTGRAEGTARITATSEGRSGSGIVTVGPIPVASVAVTPQNASVDEGASVRMSAMTRASDGSTLAGRAVTWASSDPAVASVRNDGTVTGVSSGSATVTATVEGQRATATVNVRARPADPPPAQNPDPPTVDPRPAIEQVVERFRSAFAQRDLAAMRRVFPAMTSAQENAWRDFFTSARELTVVYRSATIDVSGTTATVSIDGHFEYRLDRGGTEMQDVRVQMELRETDGGWVIASYR
jgi:serine/threonine-protein kinase